MTTLLGEAPPATAATPEQATGSREARQLMVFGTWSLIGLMLDGWAHRTDAPETFFSPWHLVLYSGFVAGMAWFGLQDLRRIRAGQPRVRTAADRFAVVGGVFFAIATVGDAVWHEIFGVEVDLEALLSPTHLGLMLGGMCMGAGAFLAVWRSPGDEPSDARIASYALGLGTLLLGFFLMFLSPFLFDGLPAGEDAQAGLTSGALVTTALVVAPALLLTRRWTMPAGACLIGVLPLAVGLAIVGGFEQWWLCAAIVAGGLVLDLVLRNRPPGDRQSAWRAAIATPPVLWGCYFLGWQVAGGGVTWPAELWTGVIVLTTVVSAGLALLVAPPAVVPPPTPR